MTQIEYTCRRSHNPFGETVKAVDQEIAANRLGVLQTLILCCR